LLPEQGNKQTFRFFKMFIAKQIGLRSRKYAAEKLSSPLARNTLWAMGGYGLRLAIQAVYFVVIARCLGPQQYGGFVAVTALANLISPFVGMGTGNLLVKNVARDKSLFAEYWGNGLVVNLVLGLAVVAFVVLASVALLPHSIPVFAILCICISDLIAVKFLEMAAYAFQAFEMLSRNAHLNVLVSLTRLVGIVALALTLHHPTIRSWSAVYLAGTIVAASIGVIWVTLSLGRPKFALGRIRGEFFEGLKFSTGLSAQTIYNDIDKTMLARLGSLEATGIYSAAYRLIDVSFIPIRALLNAAYSGFFRSGADGIRGTLRYSRRLMLRIAPYSLLTFAVLLIGAPIVPRILGEQFAYVSEALRWLSLLPLLKTLHYFAADALMGAGYQGVRTTVQVGIAIFNVLLNLWIIPAYGWRGAAWSSVASDGLLAAILWFIAIRLLVKTSADHRPAAALMPEAVQG
jgi:O-antigen/teichoic acid export membrane protein